MPAANRIRPIVDGGSYLMLAEFPAKLPGYLNRLPSTIMRIAVIGAGGHAKVVVATLLAAGHTVAGLFDDQRPDGESVLGIPVVGRVTDVVQARLPTVIAVGSNEARCRIASGLQGVEWTTAVHPSAVVHPTVALGAGAVVFAGAVLQPGTIVGQHVIINTGASVDHDGRVGDFAHLAPGSRLAGTVTIGEGVLMGIASFAVPGARVGDWTVVGAGAGVIHDLPAGVTAVGLPARPRR